MSGGEPLPGRRVEKMRSRQVRPQRDALAGVDGGAIAQHGAHVRGALAEQAAREHHAVGAGEQQLEHVLGGVRAARRREAHVEAALQELRPGSVATWELEHDDGGSGLGTTWSKAGKTGLRYVRIQLWGPGGGGGGCAATGAGEQSAAGGGGGGGYCERWVAASAITTDLTVWVYAGGFGGSGNSAGDDGDGSCTVSGTGIAMSAGPGSGGTGGGVAPNARNAGGAGGTAWGGDIEAPGGGGGMGAVIGSQRVPNGFGGTCGVFGGPQAANDAGGIAGAGWGTGGSGASSAPNTSSRTGGAGAKGACVITEYY